MKVVLSCVMETHGDQYVPPVGEIVMLKLFVDN